MESAAIVLAAALTGCGGSGSTATTVQAPTSAGGESFIESKTYFREVAQACRQADPGGDDIEGQRRRGRLEAVPAPLDLTDAHRELTRVHRDLLEASVRAEEAAEVEDKTARHAVRDEIDELLIERLALLERLGVDGCGGRAVPAPR